MSDTAYSPSPEGDAMLTKKDEDVEFKKPSTWSKWLTRDRIIVIALLALGIIILIIGIALMASAAGRKCSGGHKADSQKSDFCEFSDEAKRVGLGKFLERVKAKFYELHPNVAPTNPDLNEHEDFGAAYVKNNFAVYDPTPSKLKQVTDEAWKLREEIDSTSMDANKLTSRERRAVMKVKLFLKNVFGIPYDVIYYTGEWMMGPNYFCHQPICYLGKNLENAFQFLKPKDLKEVELLLEKIKGHKVAVEQYIKNMQVGVRKGMVRNIEACEAAINVFTRKYLQIAKYNETGVLKESFVTPALATSYYSDITADMEKEWESRTNGKNVSESVKEHLVEYIGKPIVGMIRYLKNEHLRHCVPSSVSSGLATLPLKYVYLDGKPNMSQPTDRTLPLTDKTLDGKKAYALIMSYFTTNEMTPDQVYERGIEMMNKLYPKVVAAAREVTGLKDDVIAVKRFRETLNSSKSYFNDPIPANESTTNAYLMCSDHKSAKKYCPARWDAMQKWFAMSRMAMSMLSPKTTNMFYYTGEKHSTPNCPIGLYMDLNPSRAAQGYRVTDRKCSRNALYSMPFFLERVGPKYSEWTINAHEARPGHHTQIQGITEHFEDPCGGVIAWLDDELGLTDAGVEGWALYAENPLIAEDTDTYDKHPMERYGMLKWQLWRAIRLVVDTGLHYKGMSRDRALQYFDEKAWDGTDYAEKELTRYQGAPGQATSYMIGQLELIRLRNYMKVQLGNKFSLKDYHYQVLKQGYPPLAYLDDHIKRYVACMKKPKMDGCHEILAPPVRRRHEKRKSPFVVHRPDEWHYI